MLIDGIIAAGDFDLADKVYLDKTLCRLLLLLPCPRLPGCASLSCFFGDYPIINPDYSE